MPERRTISVGGLLLSYLSSNEGGEGTVLFLHGWRLEGHVWLRAMDAVNSAGYTAIALDLPGFGKSEMSSRPYTVRDYADIVAAFLEKLNLQKCIVVGHSFGGRVAIVLAARRGDHVSKLVLVDSAGIRNPHIGRSLVGAFAKVVRPVFTIPFMKGVRKKAYTAMGAEDYVATPELNETFKLVINEDLQHFLPNIEEETLIIWGENDTATPLSHAITMQKAIPNARLEVIAEAGHLSFIDAPGRFAELLIAFLP